MLVCLVAFERQPKLRLGRVESDGVEPKFIWIIHLLFLVRLFFWYLLSFTLSFSFSCFFVFNGDRNGGNQSRFDAAASINSNFIPKSNRFLFLKKYFYGLTYILNFSFHFYFSYKTEQLHCSDNNNQNHFPSTFQSIMLTSSFSFDF